MGCSSGQSNNKAHAVCIPFPAQGHINPMLKLAKILNQKGFHITFVNTEYNHKRLLRSRGSDSLDGSDSFRFEKIPDGLPDSDADTTQDVPSLCLSTTTTCLAPFKKLLAKLNDDADVPPVSCIISDGIMSFTLEAAEELGIPEVFFWTASAAGYLSYMHYAEFLQKGYTPLKDASYLTNGYLDTVVDNIIPSMKGIRLRDIPTFIRTTDPDEYIIKFVIRETLRARRASAILINTFDQLEHDVINALSSIDLPPIIPIGPLHLLEKQLVDQDLQFTNLGSNLWKEDHECLNWLNSREPKSVVYVNFGSVTVMTPDQLTEFAWGLCNSNLPFLWILRPDLASGHPAILPEEFHEATKERGFLANWCPQEKVLSHSSVGGFLTHSGWNSTMESICNGVPMVCWPFFAEQQTNCWLACTKWGIAMEIDNDVKRDEVENLVKELMIGGERGKEMKKKALEWKNLAQESAKNEAYENIDKLINQVLFTN